MNKKLNINRPLISVVVPVYNTEKYLKHCIMSITCQTYRNLEILLVDDGSDDSSGIICDELAKTDDRICVIHQENAGLSAARNSGIDIAKGEYIGFVDSDDYIASDMYEKLMNMIRCSEADMAVCSFTYVDDQYQDIENWHPESPLKDEILCPEKYIERWLSCGYGWYYVVAWNRLYNRKLFEHLRYPQGKLHEDEFLIHRLVYGCERIACTAESLYFYVQRSGSIMEKKDPYKNTDYCAALIDRHNLAETKGNARLAVWTIRKLAYELYKQSQYKSKSYQRYKLQLLCILLKSCLRHDESFAISEKAGMIFRLLFPEATERLLTKLK